MQHPCALVIRGGLCLHHSAALVSPAHEGWSSCQLRVVGGPWSGIGHCWVGDRACWVWDRALTALAPCTWILLAEQAAEQARCAVPACRFSRKHAHRWDGDLRGGRSPRTGACFALPSSSVLRTHLRTHATCAAWVTAQSQRGLVLATPTRCRATRRL